MLRWPVILVRGEEEWEEWEEWESDDSDDTSWWW
jgi:hypothetical protein